MTSKRRVVSMVSCLVARKEEVRFGHQLVCHLGDLNKGIHNPVDGEQVPVPHYGLVTSMEAWKALRDRLITANTKFILEPQVRFKGQVGEQATMFLQDPAGNHLEFKAMRNPENLFASDEFQVD
jgi:extradiol dioxygenase family protein